MAIADTISSMYDNVGNIYDTITNVDVNTGKNLFDISTITENTYIEENGNTGSSQVTNLSDYIEVKPNASYTLSYDYSTLLNSNQRNIIYYDENNTYISGWIYLPTNKSNLFTTPNNAKYIRFSYDKNCYSIMLNEGSTALPYEPYTDNPTYKNIENIPSTIRKSYLDIMNNGIDTIYDNWEKVSGTGTSLTLNNTEEAPMTIEYKGNTYQYSTIGKNLCPPTWNSTEGNITFTKIYDENGNLAYIDVNGTASSVSYINVGIKTYSAGTYIISGSPSGGSDSTYQQRMVSGESALATDNGSGATFTLNSAAECFLRVRIASGYTANHLKFYPMVRLSSTSEGYEPYTGNQPSPNPDYPQDIQVVSGDNSIVVCGKNLANPNDIFNGYPNTVVGDKIIYYPSVNSITYKKCAYVKANTEYSLSWNYTTPKATAIRNIVICDNNEVILEYFSYSNANNNKSITFTPTKSGWVYASLDANAIEVQIEKGSSSSQYEPYQSQTQLIDLRTSKNLFDGKVEQGAYDTTNGAKSTNSNTLRNVKPIAVYPSTEYIFSINGTSKALNIFEYDKNMNFIRYYNNGAVPAGTSFTTSNTTKYINIFRGNGDGSDNWQIEKGSSVSTYEPYSSIELCKIGNYQDSIKKSTGKNLFNPNAAVNNCSVSNGIITITSNTTDLYIQGAYVYTETNKFLTLPSGNYYLKSTNPNVRITFYGNGEALDTANNQPITLASETNFGGIRIRSSNSLQNVSFGIMLSTENIDFEPYSNGRKVWYLNKQIDKVVLNGSEESWRRVDIYQGISQFEVLANDVLYANDSVIRTLSNFFKGIPYNNSWAYDKSITSVYTSRLRVMTSMYSSVDDFKTWLSTHNTTAYYVLATPTYEEIEDTTLLSQLNNLYNANSYEETTNVSQVNDDMPFVLDITALKEMS